MCLCSDGIAWESLWDSALDACMRGCCVQDLDRKRRAMEYTVYNRSLEEVKEKLDEVWDPSRAQGVTWSRICPFSLPLPDTRPADSG